MPSSPAVSVIMAVYNGEPYLAQAIDSILEQEFSDFEFIVIDDASTDATDQILQHYAALDERLLLLHNDKNLGLTKSLNNGLQQATGRYIARQDTDDVSLPGRLAEQVAYLDAHPDVVLVTGEYQHIDEYGHIVGHVRRSAPTVVIDWQLQFYNVLGAHTQVMFRRDDVLALGCYDEAFRYSQDYDLWVRLRQRGKLCILPYTWAHVRRHTANLSVLHGHAQDDLSLEVSQRVLAAQMGYVVETQTIVHLRALWVEPFPAFEQAMPLQRVIRKLWRVFVDRHVLSQTDIRFVRQHLAGRWLAWARSVSVRRYPRMKLQLWGYAFGWSPRLSFQEIAHLLRSLCSHGGQHAAR